LRFFVRLLASESDSLLLPPEPSSAARCRAASLRMAAIIGSSCGVSCRALFACSFSSLFFCFSFNFFAMCLACSILFILWFDVGSEVSIKPPLSSSSSSSPSSVELSYIFRIALSRSAMTF